MSLQRAYQLDHVLWEVMGKLSSFFLLEVAHQSYVKFCQPKDNRELRSSQLSGIELHGIYSKVHEGTLLWSIFSMASRSYT